MSRMVKWWSYLVVGMALFICAPFLLTLAGDAQVHLAVAEQFAVGEPFRFNPRGEVVVASTSPFWTMVLVAGYRLAGAWTPLLLKLAGVAIWLAAGVLLYRAARRGWELPAWLAWGVTGLWLTHTVVVANALSGLENGLGALQLLWLYGLTRAAPRPITRRYALIVGLLLGWMLLTRPDVGLFALTLLGTWLLYCWGENGRFAGNLRRTLPALLILVAVALLVLLPWYGYQFAAAGRLVTDSSLARLYAGRQGAVPLISGTLYFHPKALLSLASAFLPLVFGTLVEGAVAAGQWRRWPELYDQVAALLLVLVGLIFFSFVIGAEAFGRYFLPLYPFFFLAGVAGLRRAALWLGSRWKTAVLPVTLLTILFLAGTSGYDYYRRLGPGRFNQESVLDVIYGPANRQYYAANVPALVRAPHRRRAATAELLAELGAANGAPVSFAVTEVQLRYFLDERVQVLSLDGRTSANILDFYDPQRGVPDFARYFEDVRPDYVHANQWCAVGGWLAAFRPAVIEENLVCRWQQQTAGMEIGDSFTWDGRIVRLVAPEIVHISWE